MPEGAAVDSEDASRWLGQMADDAMARAGQFSDCGPLPLTAPDGIIAHGAERVIEFWAVLDDGTRIVTHRPLNPPAPPPVIRRRWRRRGPTL